MNNYNKPLIKKLILTKPINQQKRTFMGCWYNSYAQNEDDC